MVENGRNGVPPNYYNPPRWTERALSLGIDSITANNNATRYVARVIASPDAEG